MYAYAARTVRYHNCKARKKHTRATIPFTENKSAVFVELLEEAMLPMWSLSQ